VISRRRLWIAVWLVGLLACSWQVWRTQISTEMSVFLPRSPAPEQQALVDQVREGVAARLILLAIEGAPPETLSALSKELARRLRERAEFVLVANGEAAYLEKDRDFVWRNRYLLSRHVAAERFTAAALRRSLEQDLSLLGTSLGAVVKRSLPSDPTGEILGLFDAVASGPRPNSRDGVWFSPDGSRALLMVQTAAGGFDVDAQEAALRRIHAGFDGARGAVPNSAGTRLIETGPGVFSVRTRAAIERDATRFSILAAAVVASLLFFAYRSISLLALVMLPVLSGALAGIAAVGLGFGFIHGVTLGFGVTLIGEAVDYAIYLFTQTAPGSNPAATLPRIWPTLRLGVLVSICGFSAMLFSSFAGFAQLGLFSIVGLLVALAVTRWVLPSLLKREPASPGAKIYGVPVLAVARHAGRLRWPLFGLVALAAASFGLHRDGFWAEDLSSLSPLPAADLQLDEQLRREIGAPDVRYLVVVSASDKQGALTASEAISAVFDSLASRGAIAGYDSPAAYLPSEATQRARQSALPPETELRGRLTQALDGLPFRPDLFAPFLADIAATKTRPPLTRSDLRGTTLQLRLDSLLFERKGGWTAVLPLRGVADPDAVRESVARVAEPRPVFVDLKSESAQLLKTYQQEAVLLAVVGGLVIVALLAASLRSARRVYLVLGPLAAAGVVTMAALTAGDQKLSIFNLMGLLLAVAVGSNYSLFFERQTSADPHGDRTIASVALANLCTVVGFGVLSFSDIPVLNGIGTTVAVGAILGLVFSAILALGPRGAAAREAPR
jgi:predicted exporter